MKVVKDINYLKIDTESNKLDLYLPDREGFSTFIYFHGGGIETGDKNDVFFAEFLAEKGIAVASVNYRLYPTAVYPEYIRDAASSVAWTYNHIKEFGGTDNIFVGGSSAGAYISMMLAFDKKYLAVHNIDSDDVSGYIHDAGQPTTHFNVLRERGIDTKRIVVDDAAPLYHIKNNKNYSPMLFIVSDHDMINRYEETMLMVKSIENFDNDIDKVNLKIMKNSAHCSYLTEGNENGEIFKNSIYQFIEKNSNSKK